MAWKSSWFNEWFNVLKRSEFQAAVRSRTATWLAGLVGFIGLLADLGAGTKVSLWWILPVLILFTVICIIVQWPRDIKATFARRSTLEVVYGDLLDYAEHDSTAVVVGTSQGFVTDPQAVHRSSIQAQVTERYFQPILSDGDDSASPQARLDNALRSSLDHDGISGSTNRNESIEHDIGTIAQVEGNSGSNFLFLAYTQNDGTFVTCNPDAVWDALWHLWEHTSHLKSSNMIIAMPALGTQNAGMSDRLGTEGSIKLIIMSYAFAADLYPNGLPIVKIVLRPEQFHKLNRSDLKNFMSTLSDIK